MAEKWEESDPQSGMFPVPPNNFGIMGCSASMPPEAMQRLFDGPIAAIQPALEADRAKVLYIDEDPEPPTRVQQDFAKHFNA